jgi:hypothetical protein
VLDPSENDHSSKHGREKNKADKSRPKVVPNRSSDQLTALSRYGADIERSSGLNLHGQFPSS